MMHKFAIKIDLRNFFTDERKYAILQVNSDWSSVAGLQRRVETIFELTNIGFLTKDDCYVPAQEPIDILQTFGYLKAFVVSWTGESSTAMPTLGEPSKKVRKRKISLEHDFVSSTPEEGSKRSKIFRAKKSPEITSTNELQEINVAGKNTTITSKLICATENVKRKKSKSITPSVQQTVTEEEISNVSKASAKKQDIRRRTETLICQNVHLRFSEDEEAAEASTEDGCDFTTATCNASESNAAKAEKIIFRCALMQLPLEKSRSINLQTMPISPVEILENIKLPALAKVDTQRDLVDAENTKTTVNMEASVCATEIPAVEQRSDNNPNTSINSELCNVNSIILLEDSKAEDATNTQENSLFPEDEISEVNSSAQAADIQLNNESNTVEKLLAKSEPLVRLPDLGDILLFKLILPNKDGKTPKLTDYIVGSCEYVNRRSKAVTISLMNYTPEAEVVLKKFTTDMDNSRTEIEKISTKFSELIEPMVLKE